MKFSHGDLITIPIDGGYTPGMVMGYGRNKLTYIIKHDSHECAVEYTKELIEQFAFVSQLSIKEQRMEEDHKAYEESRTYTVPKGGHYNLHLPDGVVIRIRSEDETVL